MGNHYEANHQKSCFDMERKSQDDADNVGAARSDQHLPRRESVRREWTVRIHKGILLTVKVVVFHHACEVA